MEEEIKRGVLSLLQWLVISVIWSILLYGLGWVTLKALTVGRYPTAEVSEAGQNWIAFAGMCVVALAWGLIALRNNGLLG